ncbi:MAG: RsmB/NOP family class I SAM-dependent RNA methyltransferase [Candidatus Didemnitutus sp.]|nr:RsmB/NOP family class I SAM-dependent RNA methyltransferase [Candidatus Didemnitutus sp.]
MQTSPVLNEAARILQQVQAGTPADAALRENLARTRHVSAPARRREVSHAVFTYFRWWRWLSPRDSLQTQVAAALALQQRFDQSPASVKPEALAARAVPDWLATEMDAVPAAWLQQLQRPPALWIRPQQAEATAVATALRECEPAAPLSGTTLAALRYTGTRDLFLTQQFQNGQFEIQDLASQLVGHACAPQPGEIWWDTCAGEGGKTMHLSDLMQNKGKIWASDRSLRRLDQLKKRAARAKAFNYRSAPWEGGEKLPTKTKFDGVLVDAPCSGIGTWQRNPHARWTTQPTDVHELAAVQQRLLQHVAPSVKSGGRLIYAVCTLARAETTAVAEAFSTAHPEFAPLPLTSLGSEKSSLMLWPHELNANGMFIAAWRRR